MQDTRPLLLETDFPAITRDNLTTLQVNLGYLCNLSCTHCHVNAGPTRTELMDLDNINLILDVIKARNVDLLDLTGGAPEMNPHFRYLVTEATKLGVEVIDRCNLTILEEPGYEDLGQFLADNKVTVVASLPCYREDNVNEQRGKGVFASSISALQTLNKLGYGEELELDLVYNPNGAFLPPSQQILEQDYKQHLHQEFGITFNKLFTITNMPISRFGAVLLAKNSFGDYLKLLKNNFSADNLQGLMCRSTVSVDWQGNLYDCDFNQMLEMPLQAAAIINSESESESESEAESKVIATDSRRGSYSTPHLRDLLNTNFDGNPIVTGEHCYGCTAGQGRSCGGSLES
jgi:radical SAM/Cys-rich protein